LRGGDQISSRKYDGYGFALNRERVGVTGGTDALDDGGRQPEGGEWQGSISLRWGV